MVRRLTHVPDGRDVLKVKLSMLHYHTYTDYEQYN